MKRGVVIIDLFVDSSAWIALFSDRDKYHQIAAASFANLKKQSGRLMTSNYVFDETVTYLQRHYGHAIALRFGRWVLKGDAVELVRVDLDIWQQSWQMFQQYDDKVWAFTDCTSFILMRELGLWRAFTFDRHFEQAGFILWPGES